MAAIPPGKFPSPNPKYPFVGPNYQGNGELAGYDYNPYTDKYRPNEEAAQNAGLIPKEPEQPGLGQQMLPIAVGLGLNEASKGVGSYIGGLLESGGSQAVAEQVGEQAAGQVAQQAGQQIATEGAMHGPGGGSGLLGQAANTGMGPTPMFIPAAAIAATYLGGKDLYGLLKGKEDDKSPMGIAGRITSGIATGGLSELARATGLLGRKSTRQRAKDVTNELLSTDKENSNWQNYVQGMRGQYDSAPTDPSKPFGGGKYGSWDEYVKGGLEASDLTGVAGNMQVYGPQWADLTQEQRQAVTQKNIEAGLYSSKDGDVFITDKLKAMDIFNSIINPTPATATPMSPTGVIDPTKATPIDITRN